MGRQAPRDVINRQGPQAYDSEVERLCGYIKNDSIIRWHLGCSQAAIDYARAELARRKPHGAKLPYVNRSGLGDEMAEERLRLKRAKAGNRAYLQAIKRAGCG